MDRAGKSQGDGRALVLLLLAPAAAAKNNKVPDALRIIPVASPPPRSVVVMKVIDFLSFRAPDVRKDEMK